MILELEKTTISKIILDRCSKTHKAEIISAVITNVSEIKELLARALDRQLQGLGTLLFVDEIHRLNKAQQDIFLPYIEDGTIILIGATTENPSFEINNALLSRCAVYRLNKLTIEALQRIIDRFEQTQKISLPLTEEAKEGLCSIADGDARYLLNVCESLITQDKINKDTKLLDIKDLETFIQHKVPLYDKHGEEHYNLISALHKAIRGSDCDASIYWLQRMLDGGEDRRYILRRLARVAAEDIGLADPKAIAQVMAAKDMYDYVGSPEGELAIMQAVVYLAIAPKSNALYLAEKKAKEMVKKYGSLPPPKHILNAHTKFMAKQGYGDGYIYDHDTPEDYSGQSYLPEEIKLRSSNDNLYSPTNRGHEEKIKKKLEYLQSLKKKSG